jgi:CRISPR-associated protein Csy2
MNNAPQGLLLLPRLYVQNANAISSPLTWGFPAPTAFTGFVHAFGRRVASEFDLQLDGVGIICHRFEPQVFQPAGRRTRVFSLSRNPVDKDGKTAAIVEEGRAHFEVSLLIGVSGSELFEGKDVLVEISERMFSIAAGLRLAGGSILPNPNGRHYSPRLQLWPEDPADARTQSRKLRRQLLPGFALIERQDLLAAQGVNPLEALLDVSRLNFEPEAPDAQTPQSANWNLRRKPGWLVPVPLGYAAVSPLYAAGEVANARDNETPFCFAESLLGLGEWLSPHRVDNLLDLFWYHRADPASGLYRCSNDFSPLETHA